MQKGQTKEESKLLNIQMLRMALIRYITFNIDVYYLPRLFELNKDVIIATEYSIIMHDRYLTLTDDLTHAIKALL